MEAIESACNASRDRSTLRRVGVHVVKALEIGSVLGRVAEGEGVDFCPILLRLSDRGGCERKAECQRKNEPATHVHGSVSSDLVTTCAQSSSFAWRKKSGFQR